MSDTAASGGAGNPEMMLGPINGGIGDVQWKTGEPSEFNGPLVTGGNDRELSLQTMTLQIPEEPITINGTSYGISVNEELLAGAVNSQVRSANSKGRLEPRALSITLSDNTLPPQIADAPHDPHRPIHDFRYNGFRLEAPRELVKGSHTADQLALRLQKSLNRDLEIGMLENSALKNYLSLRKFWLRAGAVGAAAVGEAVGVATSNGSVGELLTRGTGGALIGAAVVGLATMGRQIYDIRRFGTNITPAIRRLASARARSIKRQSDEASRKGESYFSQRRKYFKQPIISLLPLEKQA